MTERPPAYPLRANKLYGEPVNQGQQAANAFLFGTPQGRAPTFGDIPLTADWLYNVGAGAVNPLVNAGLDVRDWWNTPLGAKPPAKAPSAVAPPAPKPATPVVAPPAQASPKASGGNPFTAGSTDFTPKAYGDPPPMVEDTWSPAYIKDLEGQRDRTAAAYRAPTFMEKLTQILGAAAGGSDRGWAGAGAGAAQAAREQSTEAMQRKLAIAALDSPIYSAKYQAGRDGGNRRQADQDRRYEIGTKNIDNQNSATSGNIDRRTRASEFNARMSFDERQLAAQLAAQREGRAGSPEQKRRELLFVAAGQPGAAGAAARRELFAGEPAILAGMGRDDTVSTVDQLLSKGGLGQEVDDKKEQQFLQIYKMPRAPGGLKGQERLKWYYRQAATNPQIQGEVSAYGNAFAPRTRLGGATIGSE